MTPRLRKLYEKRYEWSGMEQDAARFRQFAPDNGLLARFWAWIEGGARDNRLDVEDEIRDEKTRP